MKYTVFDIETDGLLDEVSIIHCLCASVYENELVVKQVQLTDYERIKTFMLEQETLVGHNIVRYDIPVLEKLLSIKINAKLIDTLALSWYLYPNRLKHGLEYWGDDFNIEKPKINDWKNLTSQEYAHRCTQDVLINSKLYKRQLLYLQELYNNNEQSVNAIIEYLGFKLDCAKEQEEVKCKIDLELINKSLQELKKLKDEKINNLIKEMPDVVKYTTVKKPTFYKKDGSLTAKGLTWLNLLTENNLENTFVTEITIEKSREPPNPASNTQLKNWLYQLGWTPETFQTVVNTLGEQKEVPQIYLEESVCPSITKLYSIAPVLENLDMLSLIKHRIGVFQSFLNAQKEGYVKAEIAGLTPTFRFKHIKPLANLPKVFKFYGQEVRSSIVKENQDYLICGSDMSSLEDNTKQHYIYFYDPEYVSQMQTKDFDPHLDIAVLANLLTTQQAENHKNKQEDHTQTRGIAKQVNFACVYGAGAAKISKSSGMSFSQAQKLHKTYWERNKAVKQIANDAVVKTVNNQLWIFNPISKFWCSLRNQKDKFSVINQSSGVYCFDLYIKYVRQQGIKIQLQIHDEIMFSFLKEEEHTIKEKLYKAINKVNEDVKLNVTLDISVDVGDNYGNVH